MIERYPRSISTKKVQRFLVSRKYAGFWAYFNNASCFNGFKLSLSLQTDDFLSVLFVFFHAVYWCYTLCRAKESQVFPLFSHGAEIFGIHSHFSGHQMHLLLEWNGSSDIWSLFHSGCFHKIPAAFPKNFLTGTAACFPLLLYIYSCKDNHCSLRTHRRSLLIHIHFYFSVSWYKAGKEASLHDRCVNDGVKM